ncbi:MAG: aldehyde dehydrogenase [Fimbriimonadaceae bacterium]|nr:aldehyde dehydrogenase [Fimbriimonadaceae bacterium]
MFDHEVLNWIDGQERPAEAAETFVKRSPASDEALSRVSRSRAEDVQRAVEGAVAAQPRWSNLPAVVRGRTLRAIAEAMRAERETLAMVVHVETGKSMKDARGETDGAIDLAHFFAGEGQRLFGRTLPSAVPNRYPMTLRRPIGVAGLIVAANTPIANVAWKVFPALVCGNTAVLKAPEDAPGTAWTFARIAHEAGLPPGALQVVQGLGVEAGAPLVEDPRVGVISFTGSTAVGKWIAEVGGRRLARVSLELGGKNPFVVCDDADLDLAVHWATLSAFSNAGQRCAAGSRIIVDDKVYRSFLEKMRTKAESLRLGTGDSDDLGPVINERQLNRMVRSVETARREGANVIIGGSRALRPGYYMTPTLLADVPPGAEISNCELFGPIASVYRVNSFEEALSLANDTPYGLTAAIHTASLDRAMEFCLRVRAGVAVINAGTFGSEPHMPFGGVGDSGNGTREPGTEALDVYSELKNVLINTRPEAV